MRVRPLYLVSTVLGVSSAIWVASSFISRADPSEEKFALKDGFSSYAEYHQISALVDRKSIASLSASDADLLRTVLKRKEGCRWWALSALGNLEGTELQEEFIPAVRPYFDEQPADILTRTLLESWKRHSGAKTLDLLCRDGDRNVASLAESVKDENTANSPKT